MASLGFPDFGLTGQTLTSLHLGVSENSPRFQIFSREDDDQNIDLGVSYLQQAKNPTASY